jgi:hypothetical protein
MADVVGLFGKADLGSPVPSCVAALKDLLERADAGEVIGIAVAAVNAKGSASYSVGGMIGAYGLLGALDMAKAHMITHMMEVEE